MLALKETKVKGEGDRIFGSVVERVSGVVNRHARDRVALLLSKAVLEGIVEYREVSTRLLLVKIKFGGEFWVFISAYSPENEMCDEEREAIWS